MCMHAPCLLRSLSADPNPYEIPHASATNPLDWHYAAHTQGLHTASYTPKTHNALYPTRPH